MSLAAAVTAVLVAVTAPLGLEPTGNGITPVKCWPSQGNWVNAAKKSCEIKDSNSKVRVKVSREVHCEHGKKD